MGASPTQQELLQHTVNLSVVPDTCSCLCSIVGSRQVLCCVLHAACREAGCLREALAVASTRLLHADPAVQQLRQQYAASLTPTATAQGDASAEPAQPTAAAAAARKGIKPHSEAAAANLLLLDQPAAAAMALASRDGGSNAAAMQTAAQVAALAAAHKVPLLLRCWTSGIYRGSWGGRLLLWLQC